MQKITGLETHLLDTDKPFHSLFHYAAFRYKVCANHVISSKRLRFYAQANRGCCGSQRRDDVTR